MEKAASQQFNRGCLLLKLLRGCRDSGLLSLDGFLLENGSDDIRVIRKNQVRDSTTRRAFVASVPVTSYSWDGTLCFSSPGLRSNHPKWTWDDLKARLRGRNAFLRLRCDITDADRRAPESACSSSAALWALTNVGESIGGDVK